MLCSHDRHPAHLDTRVHTLMLRASQMAGRLPEIASYANAALCCTPAGQDLLQVRDDCSADLLLAHHRAKPAMNMRASVQQHVSEFLHTSVIHQLRKQQCIMRVHQGHCPTHTLWIGGRSVCWR